MAGRKSARNGCRSGKMETMQQPGRKSAILSPHDELRERLLETALDVKENIPEPVGNRRNSRSGSISDGSESRKRRNTKTGPAAKRHSGEKNGSSSGEDSIDLLSDDREIGSSSSSSQSSRTRGQPLPVMPEEDEVFELTDEEDESDVVTRSKSDDDEDDVEDEEFGDDKEDEDYNEDGNDEAEEEEEVEEGEGARFRGTNRQSDESDEEDDLEAPCQNAEFEYTKRHLNSDSMIPAPPYLSASKCEGIGSPTKVWSLMVKRDDIPRATNLLLRNHPEMTVNMRRLLVDWISEVCESEKMHRETFHLAVDYVDRYLEAAEESCSKETFQLVGTAALFIAAKYEEIYPPKCSEFATLTDNAFSPSNIRDMEVLIAKDIGWSLGPLTSIHWLSTYLQLLGTESSDHCEETNMYVPELLRPEYVDMAKILDYCLLELESFRYSYRTLAAAVLFVTYEPKSAVEKATGFSYETLGQVIRYVLPICNVFGALRPTGDVLPSHQLIKSDDSHNIQVRIDFEQVMQLVARERHRLRQRAKQLN